MGRPAEVKEVPIKFENLDAFGQVEKTASGTGGEIAKEGGYADCRRHGPEQTDGG